MLIDPEGFAPGQSRRETTIEFKLNRDELKADFCDTRGCPFFLALTRVGAPVRAVGVFQWIDHDDGVHLLGSAIETAMLKLAGSNRSRWTRWARRFYFRNKTFTVKF